MNHGLPVKSSKSDWLTMRNEYSAHAQNIGSGQSSRSQPQARRIVGSGDENAPLCDFCEKELETIEHLFFHCTKVCTFWDDLKVVLNSLNITVRLDIKAVLFGILDIENTSTLVNYILLESKYFIYHCKLNKDSLCIRLLVHKLKKNV